LRIGLITPVEISSTGNPGWHLITAGIRWLVRAAVPEAMFVNIAMLEDRADDWRAAAACDRVVLCGNPRFSMSKGEDFWENRIWLRLLSLHEAGVRVIDGWAGSSYPYADPWPSIDEMAEAIAAVPFRRRYLRMAKSFPHHIARDRTMQRIYEAAGVSSILLPCSSWWAAPEYCVVQGSADWDVLLVHRSEYDWFVGALHGVAKRMAGRLRVIAPTLGDYDWARLNGFKPELITDPASLLRIWARTGRLFTLRVHAAIPAASVGAAVAIAAIDSRAMTCEAFGLASVRFTDLAEWEPTFSKPTYPDEAEVIGAVKGMLC
jgi:hypothetical protein